MSALDFSVEFYVHPNRRETFAKRDLLPVVQNGEEQYFAMLHTRRIGDGRIYAEISINSPESQWAGSIRPVVLKFDTGILVGKAGNCTKTSVPEPTLCQGYLVSFDMVDEIPKSETAYMFYGTISDDLTSFDQITPGMIASPANNMVKVAASVLDRTSLSVTEGDKVVVLLPYDSELKAYKDNGLGTLVPFSDVILGSNGDDSVVINGDVYRIYGELMLAGGELFIYIQ